MKFDDFYRQFPDQKFNQQFNIKLLKNVRKNQPQIYAEDTDQTIKISVYLRPSAAKIMYYLRKLNVLFRHYEVFLARLVWLDRKV